MMAGKEALETPQEVSLGNLTVNFDNFDVYVSGVHVPLSLKEFEILRVLLDHPDKILPYSTFVETLWAGSTQENRRHLSVLVHRLRHKLAGSYPFVIKTIRSRGYGMIRQRPASSEIAWRPG